MKKGELELLKKMYLGKTLKVSIDDPHHPIQGKGIVMYVDDIGQLHGTWGGLAVIPGVDSMEVID